jgi:hypothetical protein
LNGLCGFICTGPIRSRVHEHIGAGAGQLDGNCTANSAGAAGDDGNLAA